MEIKPRKQKSQAKPVSEGVQCEDNKIMVLENPLDQTPTAKSKQELLGSGLPSLAPHSACLVWGSEASSAGLSHSRGF